MLSKHKVITASFFPSGGTQFYAHHHPCSAGTFTPLLLTYSCPEFHLPLYCSGIWYDNALPHLFAVSPCLYYLK